MVKDISSGAKKFYWRFFQGESELLDSESISSISNKLKLDKKFLTEVDLNSFKLFNSIV